MTTRLSFLLLYVLIDVSVSAQQGSLLPPKDSIAAEVKRMQRGETDSVRFSAAERFDSIVRAYLQSDSALEQKPDIAPNIAMVNAPDGRFRILTWVVPAFDGKAYHFCGYLQWKSEKRQRIVLDRL
ncbi:MAG: hypothetical protein ACKO7B_05525, partial [Flavobacteriales bacterium]